MEKHLPDLLLLDWVLPNMSGLELIHTIRTNATQDIAIIMLTARSNEIERITALDSGADDYVTKPFSLRELVARVRAVLRRLSPPVSPDEHISLHGLTLDRAAERVTAGNFRLDLTPREYRMLELLMSNAEKVYTREQLVDQLWTDGRDVDQRAVDVHIKRLRKTLARVGFEHLVQTVRGVGYRFSVRAD